MSILGDKIKKERENLGWDREVLAQKLGVSYSAIAMYEQGNREPNNELILKMCELFDCSIDYLMGKTSFKNSDDFYKKMDSAFKSIYYQKYFEYLSDVGISNNDINNILDIYFVTPRHYDLVNNVDTMADKQTKMLDTILKKYSPLTYKKVLNILNELLNNKKTILLETTSLKSIKDDSNISSQYYMCPVYGRISAGQPNWAEECIEGYLPIDPNLMNIIDPEDHFFLRVNGESMNKVVANGAYALIHKQEAVENGEIAVVLVNGFEATLKKFSKQGDLVILEPVSDDPSFTTQVYGKDTEIKILGKFVGKFEMNK